MDGPPIEAWSILTLRDFAAAMMVHRQVGPHAGIRAVRLVTLAFIGLLSLAIVASLFAPPDPRRPNATAVSIVLLCILGGLGGLLVFSKHLGRVDAWLQVRRYREDQLNQRWIFGDDEIVVRTPQSDSTLRWDYFERVVESPKTFLFYVNKKHYMIVPTRAFPSGAAMERLAMLAGERAKSYVVSARCRYPEKVPPPGLADF